MDIIIKQIEEDNIEDGFDENILMNVKHYMKHLNI